MDELKLRIYKINSITFPFFGIVYLYNFYFQDLIQLIFVYFIIPVLIIMGILIFLFFKTDKSMRKEFDKESSKYFLIIFIIVLIPYLIGGLFLFNIAVFFIICPIQIIGLIICTIFILKNTDI